MMNKENLFLRSRQKKIKKLKAHIKNIFLNMIDWQILNSTKPTFQQYGVGYRNPYLPFSPKTSWQMMPKMYNTE